MLKTPQLKSIFLAILPGLLVALFVFSANIYYDLDLGKVMLTGIQKIIGQLQTTATTTLAVLEGGVGIATESPEYKLDVQGSARFGAGPTDPIVFQGYIQSGIVPYHNNYYLLGNENYRWSNLYTQEINVSATSTLAGTLLFKRDNYFYTINIPSLSANRTLNLPSEGDVTLVSGTMVPTSRTISTTAPLTGGGDLSTDRTISISGLSSLGTANYIVGVNSSETGWEYKQLSGESGEIDITHGTGSITIGIVDPLAVSKGGTGISSYTTGDILYASGATTLSKLGIGANGTILSSSGSAPEWVTLSSLSILTGSGTQNTIAKFTGTYSLGDSIISDDGSLVSVSGQLTTTGTTTLATTGGNVGIGTSNPSSFKLQVAGNVGPDSDNAYDLGSSDLRWRSLFLGGGSINVDQIGGTNFERLTIKYDTTNNTFLLQTTQGGTGTLRPLQITTGSNTGVFIDQTGKIGISTTTPSYTLDISGSLGVSQNLYLSSTSLIYIAGDSGQSGKFLKRTATGLEWSEPLATVPWPLRAPAGSEGTASAPAYSFELYTSTGMFLATSTQALAFSVAGNQVLTLATTTNVGIGTTAPSYKLDVQGGDINVSANLRTGGTIRIDSSGNLTNIGSISSTYLTTGASYVNVAGASTVFQMNGTTIITSGRALQNLTGISSSGTINFSGLTANRLVVTDASSNLTTSITSANLAASVTDETGSAGYLVFSNSPTISSPTISGGSLTFSAATAVSLPSSATALNFASGLLNLDTTNSRVGIGTTSPNEKLQVAGNVNIDNRLFVRSGSGWGGSPTISLAIGDNDTGLNWISDGNLAIYTNNAERVRIASTGNVGIGTTAPGRKLDILDSANPQTRLSYSSSIYGELKVDSAGNLNISTNPTGKDIIVSDNNMRVCSGGSCPSPYYSGSGNFQVEGTAEIDTKLKLIAVPSGVSGSYTWNLNALEVCQFGTCCPPWKDCDGDGRTYGAGTDCDEGCSSCYVGSTNGSSTPDGKDQDCDGQVDEQGTYYVKILNSASSLTCNTVCANNGGMCTSIGTDSEGTNGRVWTLDAYNRCFTVVGGCESVMWAQGVDCEGYASDWTMCRCGVAGYQ